MIKDPYKILQYPIQTEKVVRLINLENQMVFIVEKKANKQQIKDAVEALFKAKVERVRTAFTSKGKKKAYVSFSKETPAADVATRMGMM